MPKRTHQRSFDAAGKGLFDLDPLGLARWLGYNVSRVKVLNSDLVTRLAADRLLLLEEIGVILNVELQAQPDPDIRERLHAYSGLAILQHKLPVRSIVILLCKAAESDATRVPHLEMEGLSFTFRVIRLWESSPEELFRESPVLLALIPLCNVPDSQLPDMIQRMYETISQAYSVDTQKQFWSNTLVYMGLKHDQEYSNRLLEGVFKMLDLSTSTTYQGILAKGEARGKAEGKAEGEQELLIVIGRRRLGAPDAATLAALKKINSPEQLEVLASLLLDVESWSELLGNLA